MSDKTTEKKDVQSASQNHTTRQDNSRNKYTTSISKNQTVRVTEGEYESKEFHVLKVDGETAVLSRGTVTRDGIQRPKIATNKLEIIESAPSSDIPVPFFGLVGFTKLAYVNTPWVLMLAVGENIFPADSNLVRISSFLLFVAAMYVLYQTND